jgi:hypothetical protein
MVMVGGWLCEVGVILLDLVESESCC